jgi:hypothetical protein
MKNEKNLEKKLLKERKQKNWSILLQEIYHRYDLVHSKKSR